MTETPSEEFPPITELTKPQRRVLGVLVEKALTTPDAYPLSLKATTTGCNQKSNRDPITNYDESTTYDTLDELRELSLVAFVHTESGRTERYRHYVRRRFPFNEPQVAIVTELLLRGRQTLGELRGRASRMVPIDSLEQLRDELRQLQSQNYVQATGPLERRGVEVDHNFYQAKESRQLEPDSAEMPAEEPQPAPAAEAPAQSVAATAAGDPASDQERAIAQLSAENRELREELAGLAADVKRLSDEVAELRQSLGG